MRKNFDSKESVIGLAMADNGKDAGKVPCCEYAKAESGLGEFGLSVRECGNQTCPQSIFSIPSIYEKCPYRLKYQKDGVSVNQSEPKKVFVRVQGKKRYLHLTSPAKPPFFSVRSEVS